MLHRPTQNTLIILASLYASVEDLFDHHEIPPPVDAVRPSSCPGCGQPAHEPGKRLGIIGHGTYERQVVLLVVTLQQIVMKVRRYLCVGCRVTISVLPDILHPGRWYAGAVILEALQLHLTAGKTEREIREAFGIEIDSASWRTLRRWRRQLLDRLWGWLGPELGSQGPARTRGEGRRRLLRLLAHEEIRRAGKSPRTSAAAGIGVPGSVVHHRGESWRIDRAPAEMLRFKPPPL